MFALLLRSTTCLEVLFSHNGTMHYSPDMGAKLFFYHTERLQSQKYIAFEARIAVEGGAYPAKNLKQTSAHRK